MENSERFLYELCKKDRLHEIKEYFRIWGEDAKYSEYAIYLASLYGYWKVVKLLFEEERKIGEAKYSEWAIDWASEHGHWRVVKLLFEEERGLDGKGEVKYSEWAIDLASYHGHWEVVKLLFEEERKIGEVKYSEDAIDWASIYGHREVVDIIIKNTFWRNFFIKVSLDKKEMIFRRITKLIRKNKI